jgi:hypothetical protein
LNRVGTVRFTARAVIAPSKAAVARGVAADGRAEAVVAVPGVAAVTATGIAAGTELNQSCMAAYIS